MSSKRPGRPPEHNTQTKQQVIDYIVGGMTMTTAARKIGVARQTIYKWMRYDEEFEQAIKEGRAFGAVCLVDEILDIADDDSKDIITDCDGNERPNTAAVQRSKLKMDARSKLGKFYNSSMFGEKQAIDVTTNGKDVYQGLMITPPTFEEDDDE